MSNQTHAEHQLTGQTLTAYNKCLINKKIPLKQHSYYLLRANQFIKATNDQDPRKLTLDGINSILTRLTNTKNLTDWQIIQAVDAIQILLEDCFQSPASTQVDWGYWRSSVRTLAANHSTTARQHTPEELVYLKVKNSTSRLAAVRDNHRELIIRFVTEIRSRGYAYRTEETYEQWVVRYILFCDGISPVETGSTQVENYLNDLVINHNVSASTQNQALNALVFLYKQVLHIELPQIENLVRSKRKKLVPVVMTRSEVKLLLDGLSGWQKEVASLLYGTGMRVMEGLTLRVKDIDFQYERIHVCQSKGKKDRFVPLPKKLVKGLREQIQSVAVQHKLDLEEGYGEVLLPEALAKKYPNAAKELRWQFLYPSGRLSVDPRSGAVRRHHLHESGLLGVFAYPNN